MHFHTKIIFFYDDPMPYLALYQDDRQTPIALLSLVEVQLIASEYAEMKTLADQVNVV